VAAELNTDYAGFAWFYNRHWGRAVPSLFADAVAHLLLASIPQGASLLDLCCGTGQLAHHLEEQGYQVTGVDGSGEMLRYARENAPGVRLIHADVRELSPDDTFDGVYSTFDSLNHLLSLHDLTLVFRNVAAVLRPDGLFLFDMNMEEAYVVRWNGRMAIDEDDGACFLRFSYDAASRTGRCAVMMFRPAEGECWSRSRVMLHQRCYDREEVRAALDDAGLELLSVHDGTEDLRMTGQTGRAFFLARRKE
jgi:SAM-dependent methyltransferase